MLLPVSCRGQPVPSQATGIEHHVKHPDQRGGLNLATKKKNKALMGIERKLGAPSETLGTADFIRPMGRAGMPGMMDTTLNLA